MLVRCERNSRSSLTPEEWANPQVGNLFGSYDEVHLQVGNYYVVYAFESGALFDLYFIADEVFSSYPFAYLSLLFSVVDDRPSRYWALAGGAPTSVRAFPEWVADPYFYDKLTDGEAMEMAVFDSYKDKMDREFPRPDVTDVAVHLADEWLQCAFCGDSWGSLESTAIVRCPQCKRQQQNPTWRGV